MNEVVTLPTWAWTIVFSTFGLLISLVAWFAKREISRVERDFEVSRQNRNLEVGALRTEIREAREEHRALERIVDRECINGERLEAALKPLVDQMGNFRADIKELFSKLDGKQDKLRGGH